MLPLPSDDHGLPPSRYAPDLSEDNFVRDADFGRELVDIADLMKSVDFKVFNGPANDPASRVVALRVPDGGRLSRKEIDEIFGA